MSVQGSDSVIPFAPAARSSGANDADQLDTAGQTILRLLHKAAGVAEANSQHALDMAQKLSHQLVLCIGESTLARCLSKWDHL